MKRQEVHLELLLGKRVFTLNDQALGRLEEVRAEPDNRGYYFVTEYLVGSYAVLERLSAWRMGRTILRTLHLKRQKSYRVHWEQLDLSDPAKPRLKCAVDELVALT